MLMFMNKKGYTLIEVMLGLSLFSILLLGVFSLELSKIKLKAGNKHKENYVVYMNALKVSIINNLTYDELVNLYKNGNKYINPEHISIDALKGNKINHLFESVIHDDQLYLDINLDGEKPVKITMKYHIDTPYNSEVIICEFYKGSYH